MTIQDATMMFEEIGGRCPTITTTKQLARNSLKSLGEGDERWALIFAEQVEKTDPAVWGQFAQAIRNVLLANRVKALLVHKFMSRKNALNKEIFAKELGLKSNWAWWNVLDLIDEGRSLDVIQALEIAKKV